MVLAEYDKYATELDGKAKVEVATATSAVTEVVETVEEAVIDAMIANEAMTGANGLTVPALPHDQLLALIQPSASS